LRAESAARVLPPPPFYWLLSTQTVPPKPSPFFPPWMIAKKCATPRCPPSVVPDMFLVSVFLSWPFTCAVFVFTIVHGFFSSHSGVSPVKSRVGLVVALCTLERGFLITEPSCVVRFFLLCRSFSSSLPGCLWIFWTSVFPTIEFLSFPHGFESPPVFLICGAGLSQTFGKLPLLDPGSRYLSTLCFPSPRRTLPWVFCRLLSCLPIPARSVFRAVSVRALSAHVVPFPFFQWGWYRRLTRGWHPFPPDGFDKGDGMAPNIRPGDLEGSRLHPVLYFQDDETLLLSPTVPTQPVGCLFLVDFHLDKEKT